MRKSAGTFAAFCREFARAAAGGAAIEMALVAPVLVFLAAAMVDFGLGIYTKMAVANAAQAGAAYAQLNANCSNTSTCYNNISCASNSPPCAFDTAIQTAAQKVAPSTVFMSSLSATANVLFCCISSASGAVDLGSNQGDCAQPGATKLTCVPASPAAGTYVLVSASASFSTILPYSFISQKLSLGINLASPLTMSSNYLVRIQ